MFLEKQKDDWALLSPLLPAPHHQANCQQLDLIRN